MASRHTLQERTKAITNVVKYFYISNHRDYSVSHVILAATLLSKSGVCILDDKTKRIISKKTPVKMTANFLQVKVSSTEMIGIHRKNLSIMLRPTKVQGLIQDLVYARKAVSRTPDPRIIDEMN